VKNQHSDNMFLLAAKSTT